MGTARRHHGDRAGGAGRVQQQLQSRQRGLRPGHGDAAKIQAADGDRFTPKTLELPAGKAVTIEITNTEDRPHVFAIEAANPNQPDKPPSPATGLRRSLGLALVCRRACSWAVTLLGRELS
jgi:Cupredoxin-like domain